MSDVWRTAQKTKEILCWRLSDKTCCDGHIPEAPWASPGSILDRVGPLLGVSWTSVGLSCAPLGRSSARLGCLGGTFWVFLGWSWMHLGSLVLPQSRFQVVLGRSRRRFGVLWGWFSVCFLRVAVGFLYIMHYLLQGTHVGFHLGFFFLPAARRYVRSTWNWLQIPKKIWSGYGLGVAFRNL